MLLTPNTPPNTPMRQMIINYLEIFHKDGGLTLFENKIY